MVIQCAEVKKACARAQTLLFSATFNDDVMEFAKRTAKDATMITVEKEKVSLDNIVQLTMDCESADDKYEQLATIYTNIDTKQSIIFCNTVADTRALCKKLQVDGYNVSVIYGAMQAHERDSAIADFREGKTKVLISTNVLSRGLDVPAVSLIINYDLPVTMRNGAPKADPDTYVHRIGRSGRFGRKACSINLTHDQKSRDVLKTIEDAYSHPTLRVPRDVDVVEEIVLAAYEGKRLRPEDVKFEE
jgi:ATP-dependent RNA helicase DDX19/DBP5